MLSEFKQRWPPHTIVSLTQIFGIIRRGVPSLPLVHRCLLGVVHCRPKRSVDRNVPAHRPSKFYRGDDDLELRRLRDRASRARASMGLALNLPFAPSSRSYLSFIVELTNLVLPRSVVKRALLCAPFLALACSRLHRECFGLLNLPGPRRARREQLRRLCTRARDQVCR